MGNSGMKKDAKWSRLALMALCAAPFVLADGLPTSAPQPGDSLIFSRAAAKAEADRNKALHGPVTEEDWKAAQAFLAPLTPHRLTLIEHLPHGQHRDSLKRLLVNQWRGINALKTQAPALYQTRIKELKLSDDIFAICLKMKRGNSNKDPALRAQLRTTMDELFTLGLEERKERISLVEKSLVVQKKSLEVDDRNRNQIISERVEHVLKHGVEGARFDKGNGKAKNGSTTSPGESESESEPELIAPKQ